MSLSELIKRKDIKLNLLNPLATATKSIAAIYVACVIDITKASVFVQSHGRVDVATKFCHTNCSVNRMIQFKEKSCKTMSKSAFLISPESIFLTQKMIQTKILEVILDFHARVTTTVRIKRKGKRECKEEDSQGYNRVNKHGKLTRVEADASSGKTSRHFKDYVGKAPFKLHTVEDLFKSSLIESGNYTVRSFTVEPMHQDVLSSVQRIWISQSYAAQLVVMLEWLGAAVELIPADV
ncbi:hypothetical protein NE237_021377 [Protea cynaroides]|uniref:Uncharacterized protein n=1 Tax=Protea cynaroides TaxID=273540 RepID=A0A9Q0HCA8_9MAGN|nr:hypothetical protein NE237_021377 [Protea cynaroides]